MPERENASPLAAPVGSPAPSEAKANHISKFLEVKPLGRRPKCGLLGDKLNDQARTEVTPVISIEPDVIDHRAQRP